MLLNMLNLYNSRWWFKKIKNNLRKRIIIFNKFTFTRRKQFSLDLIILVCLTHVCCIFARGTNNLYNLAPKNNFLKWTFYCFVENYHIIWRKQYSWNNLFQLNNIWFDNRAYGMLFSCWMAHEHHDNLTISWFSNHNWSNFPMLVAI